jgi:uncharacterized membrane protein YczE
MLLLQGIPTQYTFTIGWVDLVIMAILVITFFRWQMLFRPLVVIIVALYFVRLFPNETLWVVDKINQLNGPAAFITIGR